MARSRASSTAPRLWPVESKAPDLITASQAGLVISFGSTSSHSECSVSRLDFSPSRARPASSPSIAFWPVPLMAPKPKRIASPSGWNSQFERWMSGGRTFMSTRWHSSRKSLILSEDCISQDMFAATNSMRWCAFM